MNTFMLLLTKGKNSAVTSLGRSKRKSAIAAYREVRISGIQMGYVEEARENHVKKKVEEALRSKMKQKALKECTEYTSKYAECASGRTISVVWKCRKQAKELNECLHQYTNDSVLEQMKREYMLQQEGKGSEKVMGAS